MLPLESPDRLSLLIAEDDPHWRQILQRALPGPGVVIAPDGESALDAFARQPADVVVTDLVMPGIGGLDVLRVVKQTDPSCVVVLMSAHATLDSVIEALNGGAIYFYEKTRPIEELVRVVARQRTQRTAEQRTRALAAELLRRSSRAARGQSDDREQALRVLVDLYQATLRALPHGIAVVDDEGVVLLANAALSRRLGREPHTLVGQPLGDLLDSSTISGDGMEITVAGQQCAVHIVPPLEDDPYR